jgi:hypothetical protein
MCSSPDFSAAPAPAAKQFQQSQSPVYRDRAETPTQGRRGTMLTGGSGVQSSAPTMKKTMLGA